MDSLTLEEAKKLLEIDKHSLDEVCQKQAEYYYEIADMCVNVIGIKDFKKEHLADVDAEIANEIRQDAMDMEEKITEAKIQQGVQLSKKHTHASRDFLESKLTVDKWSVLERAFLQRASMVKRLCELYIAGYFAVKEVKGNKETGEVEVEGIRRRLKNDKNKIEERAIGEERTYRRMRSKSSQDEETQ